MANLRLLSLDFDGTMIAPWESEPATISQPLVDHLNLLRRHGAIIAMNTGRTLELVDKALKPSPLSERSTGRKDLAGSRSRNGTRTAKNRTINFIETPQTCSPTLKAICPIAPGLGCTANPAGWSEWWPKILRR